MSSSSSSSSSSTTTEAGASAASSSEMAYRRLAVFGGTGPMGDKLVSRALSLGHHVRMLARNPKAVTRKHDNLEVIAGDVLKADDVANTVKGTDAVMSCIGVHGSSPWNKTTLYSESMKNITNAMASAGVSRVVSVTSWGIQDDEETTKDDSHWAVQWFARPTFMKGFFGDMRKMEKFLQASSFNYTVARPAGLKNGPSPVPDTATLAELRESVSKRVHVGVERFMLHDMKWSINRADVADWMLLSLYTHEFDRKCVAVGVKE